MQKFESDVLNQILCYMYMYAYDLVYHLYYDFVYYMYVFQVSQYLMRTVSLCVPSPSPVCQLTSGTMMRA